MNWQIPEGFALEVFLTSRGEELSEDQKKFLGSIIGNNVVVRIKKSKDKDPIFKELVNLLKEMEKNGSIQSLQVVEK
ncbi:MAG: hypothetical protein A3D35_03720 [Candidatus Staskawiczbacteria bacterium RIFCSPHIGHO2_02_FULL_34_9]|uniref:Uncharacterized protein n=1 Tax=Candidatus Staskawiczbacteria bacterium RIFCSPHIGHO2_02_FULL_34_9 TaxID=1802206 RepID=A0A1G2HZ54_9BACT|nr:MAG: hypothetical protein A3D35_03720 [Candidatus Staskawiczbacteria bacterium RIFCSPHIGHO2_02_FULL_34_9]